MNFNFKLDLESLAKQSDDIIRNICHSEANALNEFKTKITAIFSGAFLQDFVCEKLSFLNRIEIKYLPNESIKCGHLDTLRSEIFIEEMNINGGRRSDTDSQIKMSESGFFEVSGFSSSGERVITSGDERKQDDCLLHRIQNLFAMSDKKKDSGVASSKNGDGCKLLRNVVTADIDFNTSVPKKSFKKNDENLILEKEDAIYKTSALLNTTYIVEDRGISTPTHAPIDSGLLFQSKFSYLQSIERRRKKTDRSSETLMQQQGNPSGGRSMKPEQRQERHSTELKNRMNLNNKPPLIQRRHFKTRVPRKIKEQLRQSINRSCSKSWLLRNVKSNKRFKHDTEASNKTELLGLVINSARTSQIREIPKTHFEAAGKKECPPALKRTIAQIKCSISPMRHKYKIPNEPEKRSTLKCIVNLGAQTNKLNRWNGKPRNSKKFSTVKRDTKVNMKDNSMKYRTPVNFVAVLNHDDLLEEEVASWAEGVGLKEALLRQHHCSAGFNPDDFFGSVSRIVQLQDIFGSSAYNRGRSSSAYWSS